MMNINTKDFLIPISSIKNIINIQTDLLEGLKNSINDKNVPFVTVGVLDFNFENNKTPYNYYYNVPLKDPSQAASIIYLDIPKSYIETYRLHGSEMVKVMGYLRVNEFNNVYSMRFLVIGLDVDTSNQILLKSNKSFADFFKNLSINRVPFPIYEKLQIAIITPINGDAFLDLTKEIDQDNSSINIMHYPTNLLSKELLLETLNKLSSNTSYNILIIARGGGSIGDFSIFDDIEICEKVANFTCHKIIGLGHSSNKTLLELVVEKSFQTPTAVGRYINSTIEKFGAIKDNFINSELSCAHLSHQEVRVKLEMKSKFKQNIIYALMFIIMLLAGILYYTHQ